MEQMWVLSLVVLRGRVWETTVNNKELDIVVKTVPSLRRDQAVKLVHVVVGNSTYSFVVKVIDKEWRCRDTNNFNYFVFTDLENGMYFLVNELAIRTQTNFSGLCKLMAVRVSQHFVFECVLFLLSVNL